MYGDTIECLGDDAAAKLAAQRISPAGHVIRSVLAGMYVGAAVVLVLVIGASLPREVQKLAMGVSFGGALTIVVFAGSELFTGSNLVLTLGVLTGKARTRDLASNWTLTWIGNLVGSVALAAMVVESGVLDADPVKSFVLSVVDKKMHLPEGQLFWRAVLANWLVCLAVWMAGRAKSESAKITLIWWCMFTFVACGYEHSVANMCAMMLALLLPHAGSISFAGYGYNLALATAGNVVGGAFFVGGMYWLGRSQAPGAHDPAPVIEVVGVVRSDAEAVAEPAPGGAE